MHCCWKNEAKGQRIGWDTVNRPECVKSYICSLPIYISGHGVCVPKQPSTGVWLAPVEIFPWQQTPAAAEELYLNPGAQ